mmetsp:Transcript_17214/g.39919  ORF Transcript_17214/g.39919 Transcript_17214/m.39919 type:complete len:115 (+) Transcript_17214:736-1080(+)
MEEDIDDIDDVFGGAPDEEKSGITGNEGAYLQYWYFRAAVLFWPTSRLGSSTGTPSISLRSETRIGVFICMGRNGLNLWTSPTEASHSVRRSLRAALTCGSDVTYPLSLCIETI